MEQNYEQAKMHLDALAGKEGGRFTFQTFDDCKARGDSSLTRIINGTLDDCWDTLAALNERGAGVFVTVNETDGRGRRKENIVSLRSAYFEIDGSDEYIGSPIKESMVIRSKNGPQVYFLLEPGQDMNNFESLLEGTIDYFKADPKNKDINRVFRVAGFYHQKDPSDPFLVKVVSCQANRRYLLNDLFNVFPTAEKRRDRIERASNRSEISYYTPSINQKGDFMKIVNGGCPALTEVWSKESRNVGHYERVALLSIAVNCEKGEQHIFDKWPSTTTWKYIDYALKRKELPWSCQRLQEEGICVKCKHPLFKDHCFSANPPKEIVNGEVVVNPEGVSKKEWALPSPYRIAFGLKRIFRKRKLYSFGGRNV